MAKMTPEEMKDATEWYERTQKHWRAWGSWFSWGSPVGLGLFFLALAGTIWILTKVFQSIKKKHQTGCFFLIGSCAIYFTESEQPFRLFFDIKYNDRISTSG